MDSTPFPYRIIDHTADLGIIVKGSDKKNLFIHAALAMINLMVKGNKGNKKVARDVIVEGVDFPDLMVKWLGEILYLFAGEKLIADSIVINYLNQTQLADNVTPDMSHESWATFNTSAFGTGLFNFSNYTSGIETILKMNQESWWLNPTIANDPKLDWVNRFGDFLSCPSNLRIRIIPDLKMELVEFESGKIDIVDRLTLFPEKLEQYSNDSRIDIQDNILLVRHKCLV